MGNINPKDNNAILSEGMTILTASNKEQYALEENGSGVFTNLQIDAMNGSASDLIGNSTPGSIYAHIDQSLWAWEQRPIFKTNVRSFTTLRKVQLPISLSDLKKITELFPDKGQDFILDPSFEPESEKPKKENIEKFKLLQKYNMINSFIPVDAEHTYFAARENKSCKLTILGENYRSLIKKDRI